MGYEQPLLRVGLYPADVDMSNKAVWQFAPVWLAPATTTTGTGVGGAALTGAGALGYPPFGILQNNPKLGESGLVLPFGCGGISKALLKGNVAIGNFLTANVGGTGLIVVAAGGYALAIALETGATGDYSTVMLVNNGKQ